MRSATATGPKTAKKKSANGGDHGSNGTSADRLPDLGVLTSAAGMAGELAKAADALAVAMETGVFCPPLDHNLRLWTAIKTVIDRAEGEPGGREGLVELANLVAASTLALAPSLTVDAVMPLIGLDLEIAKGLVDGIYDQLTRDRAYFLWLEAGGGHGADQRYWLQAESEIRGTPVN